MIGLILSRAGLWSFDLSITQLQQENVAEEERGIVGSVQYSFNCLLFVLRYGLAIALPNEEHFGILIVISISSVGAAGLIYLVFLSRFNSPSSKNDELTELVTLHPTRNDDPIDKENPRQCDVSETKTSASTELV